MSELGKVANTEASYASSPPGLVATTSKVTSFWLLSESSGSLSSLYAHSRGEAERESREAARSKGGKVSRGSRFSHFQGSERFIAGRPVAVAVRNLKVALANVV